MVVRPEAIRVRLNKLHEVLAKLERIRLQGTAAYDNDDLLQSAAERALQIASQCVLDIGNHIIAEMSLPLPHDNDEIIDTLATGRIISKGLADRLSGLGGFRNILVHDYLSLDQDRIYFERLERLDDFRDFAAEVLKFLEETKGGQQQ